MSKRRKSKASAVAEVYASPAVQTILTGGAGLLAILAPPAGIALAGVNAFAATAIGRRAQMATEELLEHVKRQLAALELAGKLGQDRADRLEWDLAAHKAVFANAQDPGRTELYANLLAGSLSVDAPDDLDLDALLAAIRDLPLGAVRMAREMYEMRVEPGQPTSGFLPPGAVFPPLVGPDRQLYIARLEAAGLIKETFMGGPQGQRPTGNYELTPSLIRLLETLEAGQLSKSSDGSEPAEGTSAE